MEMKKRREGKKERHERERQGLAEEGMGQVCIHCQIFDWVYTIASVRFMLVWALNDDN